MLYIEAMEKLHSLSSSLVEWLYLYKFIIFSWNHLP
jgi:hypothetical protein